MDKITREFHEKQAKICFNKTWDFIEMDRRSEDDNLNMIHSAHASRYHWGEIGTPVNFERGERQISKVYTLRSKAEQALYHGEACLKICLENDIKDFDMVFAYEAIANAYNTLGKYDKKEHYKILAYAFLEDIKDPGDVSYTETELGKI